MSGARAAEARASAPWWSPAAERGDRRGGRARRRRGRADRPRPALRHRPHLRGACTPPTRTRRHAAWSTCRATCRRSIPRRCAAVLEPLAEPGVDIGTLAAAIRMRARADRSQRGQGRGRASRPSGGVGRALYFTRATVPGGRGPIWHHIGIYAYRRAALERFVALPPSPLERRERLEQLRALEAGMSIGVRAGRHRAVRRRHARPTSSARARILATQRAMTADATRKAAGHADPSAPSPSRASPAPTRTWPAARPIPRAATLPCPSFEDAFAAVRDGQARLAMIPVDNSVAGRVADIHHLLPGAGLHIVGEHFQRVNHQLLARRGRDARRPSHRREPRPRARPVPRRHPAQLTAEAGRRRRHRRRRRRHRRARRHRRGPRSPRALAAEIYGLEILQLRHRGRRAQHDPLPGPGARADATRPRRTARSSPPSSSASATCRPRSTRRWAASPPTAST